MESEWIPHTTKSAVIARPVSRTDRPDYSRKLDPPPEPGQFKTMAQFKAWVSQRFPRATLVTEGLDLKAWKRIALILDGLALDWPEVADRLGWITTRHVYWDERPRGAIAAADSISGEKLAFNPYYFQSPKRIRQVVQRGEQDRFHPRGASEAPECYLVSHEWAHLVAAYLRRHDKRRWAAIAALFRQDPEDTSSRFDWTKASPVSIDAEISMEEAFAEAFSATRWQPERLRPDIVTRLVSILRGGP
jgi:hypothetical protein